MADILASTVTNAVLERNADIGAFSGTLEKAGDHDWIRVELSEGATYTFYLSFLNAVSLTEGNSTLGSRHAAGDLFLSDDDGGVGENSVLSFEVPASQGGIYFLDIGAKQDLNAGTYSLFSSSSPVVNDVVLNDFNNSHSGIANERTLGGKGADYINIANGRDALGEQGNDIIIGNAEDNEISGGLGDDTFDCSANGGSNFLFGDAGNDVIFGGTEHDEIYGGIGSDFIDGGDADDEIIGGLGKDLLTGGIGGDRFRFSSTLDSVRGAARDVIQDFSLASGDFIDLAGIDAKKGGGDNQFKFIAKQHFHHKAGELHYLAKGDFLVAEGDVNGDGRADFQIEVHGVSTLAAGDFLL